VWANDQSSPLAWRLCPRSASSSGVAGQTRSARTGAVDEDRERATVPAARPACWCRAQQPVRGRRAGPHVGGHHDRPGSVPPVQPGTCVARSARVVASRGRRLTGGRRSRRAEAFGVGGRMIRPRARGPRSSRAHGHGSAGHLVRRPASAASALRNPAAGARRRPSRSLQRLPVLCHVAASPRSTGPVMPASPKRSALFSREARSLARAAGAGSATQAFLSISIAWRHQRDQVVCGARSCRLVQSCAPLGERRSRAHSITSASAAGPEHPRGGHASWCPEGHALHPFALSIVRGR